MKRFIISATFLCVLVALIVPCAFAQLTPDLNQPIDKRAQTGMKFLSMSLDARAAGFGNAMASIDRGSSVAMFYNPATMGMMQSNLDVVIGQAQWIADINYNFASLAIRPADGAFGVFGVNFLSVDYGEFQGTIRSDSDPLKGYEDTGTFSPQALAIGVGYSLAVTDRFSFGGGVKYVREELTDKAPFQLSTSGSLETKKVNTDVFAVDFGILYRTGFRSLNFGVAARNFASDRTYVEESFELPLTIQLGLSMNLMDFTSADKSRHSLLFSVDAVRPRDFDEHIRFGAEYTLANKISLRTGYSAPNDEEGISLGGGLQTKLGQGGLRLDYAYTSFGVFDNVNRFTFSFSF